MWVRSLEGSKPDLLMRGSAVDEPVVEVWFPKELSRLTCDQMIAVDAGVAEPGVRCERRSVD
jgi:hypothetical protein